MVICTLGTIQWDINGLGGVCTPGTSASLINSGSIITAGNFDLRTLLNVGESIVIPVNWIIPPGTLTVGRFNLTNGVSATVVAVEVQAKGFVSEITLTRDGVDSWTVSAMTSGPVSLLNPVDSSAIPSGTPLLLQFQQTVGSLDVFTATVPTPPSPVAASSSTVLIVGGLMLAGLLAILLFQKRKKK